MTIQEFFVQNPVTAVAFSGGVDSAWLLHEARTWARQTAAYFVRTPFQPDFELKDARNTAQWLGVTLTVIDFDILTVPQVTANPPNRCYYCKHALFTRLLEAAEADGFPMTLDGCNASDDASDRPGMAALAELGVRSPLRECGLTKEYIRAAAHCAGLPVWDKPSYACLATRIPAGTAITSDILARVARGESTLLARGFTDFRLRLRGDGALLQVRAEQMGRAREMLPALEELLRDDFAEITLDSKPRSSRET